MKDQVLYLFDPLCGWCYGFSETMLEFYKQHYDACEFVPVTGGMITGDRVKPYATMNAYISSAYVQVEQTTGSKYGDEYINRLIKSNSILMNSEPPSRAVITFRTFFPERSLEFSHKLQRAHFYHGRDYNDITLYQELIADYELDPAEFINRYNDKRMMQNVQQEFAWVNESGVQGFPTVVYRAGQKYYMLSHGYASLDVLNQSFAKARKMVAG